MIYLHVFSFIVRENSQNTNTMLNLFLAMMDIICSSEAAVEPKLTDLGYSLQESLMGMQYFLMLAEQKRDGGQQ